MVGQHERKKRFVLIIALGIRQFGSLTPFCSISVLMCNDLTCPPFFWVSLLDGLFSWTSCGAKKMYYL